MGCHPHWKLWGIAWDLREHENGIDVCIFDAAPINCPFFPA